MSVLQSRVWKDETAAWEPENQGGKKKQVDNLDFLLVKVHYFGYTVKQAFWPDHKRLIHCQGGFWNFTENFSKGKTTGILENLRGNLGFTSKAFLPGTSIVQQP